VVYDPLAKTLRMRRVSIVFFSFKVPQAGALVKNKVEEIVYRCEHVKRLRIAYYERG